MKRKNRKILLTGGHAGTTGLAVIEKLSEESVEIFWIGATTAFEGKKVKTIEDLAFDKSLVKVYKIPFGKINRKHPHKSILSFIKIPFGLVLAFVYLLKIRPKVVLSFGGSVSVPVVFVSWLFRIPVILHEQTTAAGKANVVAARFANHVAISRPESKSFFPQEKVVLTGNPVGSSIKKIKLKNKISKKPNLLVLGGSRGATVINQLITGCLEDLLEMFSVYHITGQIDYDKQRRVKQKLSKEFAHKYHVYKVVPPGNMYKMYNLSDIIVSRSGANTVSEILFAKRPVVFIPIPWSYNDEQTKNAKSLEKLGLAIVLNQDRSDSKDLYMAIQMVLKDWDKMIASSKSVISPDTNASKTLSSIVLKYI